MPGEGRTVFYLVRHGKAEEPRGAGDDARRLTADGRDAFAALVRALAPSLPLVRIVASPSVRARETAGILAAATGAPASLEPALAPGRSGAEALLARGREAGNGVALVGHNPEMGEAVARAGRVDRMPPGSVAAVEATAGGFRLLWIRSP
ncbi:MAG: SixA phosphatase family protein [Myxococcaceae bacterium]